VTALARHPRLERRLARFLRLGTWLACLVLAVGFALSLLDPDNSAGLAVMMGGIGLFILLPVLRVALMLATFARERDHVFALVALTVLAIILAGAVLGMYLAG
jgi:uncharacterized membrane protein